MSRLLQRAKVMRSKNAGPLLLTLDVIFTDRAGFELAAAALEDLRRQVVAGYGVADDRVTAIAYPPANAIKFVLPRSCASGDPGDRDVYGAQQHNPLMELML